MHNWKTNVVPSLLAQQTLLLLKPATVFMADVFRHWDIRGLFQKFWSLAPVPEKVTSDVLWSCFLCLLCQCLPATSCTFSVSYCLWQRCHSQQSGRRSAVLGAVFGMVPWWLRGQEGEVEDDISAWLLFFCSFPNRPLHHHPQTHTHTQTPTTARREMCFICGEAWSLLFSVPRKVSDVSFSNLTLKSFQL